MKDLLNEGRNAFKKFRSIINEDSHTFQAEAGELDKTRFPYVAEPVDDEYDGKPTIEINDIPYEPIQGGIFESFYKELLDIKLYSTPKVAFEMETFNDGARKKTVILVFDDEETAAIVLDKLHKIRVGHSLGYRIDPHGDAW